MLSTKCYISALYLNNMWLIPYERFSITTSSTLPEVKSRLEETFENRHALPNNLTPAEVRDILDGNFTYQRYKKTKKPVIATNPPAFTYYFIPVVKGRNSFIPFIKCHASENSLNTKLSFRFRTHPILLIFFAPFLLTATGILNSKPGYNIMKDPTAYLVIMAIYFFFLIMFKYESQKVKKDLRGIFVVNKD